MKEAEKYWWFTGIRASIVCDYLKAELRKLWFFFNEIVRFEKSISGETEVKWSE